MPLLTRSSIARSRAASPSVSRGSRLGALHDPHVLGRHRRDEVLKGHGRRPSEHVTRLGWIPDERRCVSDADEIRIGGDAGGRLWRDFAQRM